MSALGPRFELMRALRLVLEVAEDGSVSDAVTSAIADIKAEYDIDLVPPATSTGGAEQIPMIDPEGTPSVFWTLSSVSTLQQYPTGGRLQDFIFQIESVTHYSNTYDSADFSINESAEASALYAEMLKRAILRPEGVRRYLNCATSNVREQDFQIEDYFNDGSDTEFGHHVTQLFAITIESTGYEAF